MDADLLVSFIRSCQSYDGGIGQHPFNESHAGSTYCAIAALHLVGRLTDSVLPSMGRLATWCLNRQTKTGFHGRPNKPPDSCYTLWVGGSLRMLGIFDYVDKERLRDFVLDCQCDQGGFSKWPDHLPDLLHSYFSLAGLAIMNEPGVSELDPALNISKRAVSYLKNLPLWTRKLGS